MALPPGTPNLQRLKDWLGPSALSVPNADLQLILDAAVDKVFQSCHTPPEPEVTEPPTEWDPLPKPLQESILRRAAKGAASKGIPLGVIPGDSSEFQGPITVRRWDAEIEDREEFFRKWAIA